MENANFCRTCGASLPPGMAVCNARCFWAYEENLDQYLFVSAHKPHGFEQGRWLNVAREILHDPWHRDAWHANHGGRE